MKGSDEGSFASCKICDVKHFNLQEGKIKDQQLEVIKKSLTNSQKSVLWNFFSLPWSDITDKQVSNEVA